MALKHLIGILALAYGLSVASAQPATTAQTEVFSVRSGTDRADLIFVDMVTGGEQRAEGLFAPFTVTPQGILSVSEGQVRLTLPDGSTQPHPFIRLPQEANRIDFAVSADGQALAWTITAGPTSALVTETWVNVSGSGQRVVFRDGPHSGIRAFPVSFADSNQRLIMDFQPDTIAALAPFQQYASLFSLDLTTGATVSLPGEAGCFCGGAVRGSLFARMVVDESGFAMQLTNLVTGQSQIIDSPAAPDFTLGGDVVIAPSGTMIVYALARAAPGGRETQLVLVDSAAGSARLLGEVTSDPIRPIAWTQDGGAILLMQTGRDGTWRIDIKDGALRQVAEATLIGSMPSS